MCEQQIVRKSKLTHIAFSSFEPILLVGDEKGVVLNLKLSPNLRKLSQDLDGESEKLDRVVNAAKGIEDDNYIMSWAE